MIRPILAFVLFCLFACSKDPVVENQAPAPPPPLPPVAACPVAQILVNPDGTGAAKKDTLFFRNGMIQELREPDSKSVFTYENGVIARKEGYDRSGQLRQLSTFENNAGAGQLLVERKRNPANPAVIDSFTSFSMMTADNYLDRIREVNHYDGANHVKRRYVIVWDNSLEQIQSISVRNEANYPVAEYTFTSNDGQPNPFRQLFPEYINLYVAEPSSFPEAVKIALLFSRKAVAKVTATIPGFQPLNVSYTTNARNVARDVVVNGVVAWRFRYDCE
jgi:hypothetical protein